MAVPRNNAFVALRLASGKVLVAGGSASLTTELYDPATGTFTPTGNLNVARYYDFAGTLLKDGRVFVVGSGTSGNFLASGEIYDPATGKWALTADMKFGRTEHLTILLPDGRVLVPGGVAGDAIKYSDIYDPVTNSWTPMPNLKIARRTFAGGLLNDGRVLVVGGEIVAPPFYTETAEIYDPVANTWTSASSMAHGRYAVFRWRSCCNAACNEQCEACDVQGGEGHCVPVAGQPHGSRLACSGGDPGNPCGAAACDGIERTSCQDFVGSSVSCREASCSAGVATLAGVCDGTGQCPAAATRECAPYGCAGNTCGASCESDSECDASAVCDLASGKCVTPAKCADADTVEAPNGGLVACAPFRCENGACLTSCTSVKDCAASYVCGASGVCQKATPAAEADSSSGCASAPARGSPAPYRALGLFLLGLPLLLRMRARRHARRPKR